MSQSIHLHVPETRDPFLHAFRAEAAARYQRIQSARRRAEYEAFDPAQARSVAARATLVGLSSMPRPFAPQSRGRS